MVDVTTPKIVGAFLVDKDRSVLYQLVKSKNLWERRIAVLACFAFIAKNDFKDVLKIAKLLLEERRAYIVKFTEDELLEELDAMRGEINDKFDTDTSAINRRTSSAINQISYDFVDVLETKIDQLIISDFLYIDYAALK